MVNFCRVFACGKQAFLYCFVGKPASLYVNTNCDWAPTLNLGHDKLKPSLGATSSSRYKRTADRAANKARLDTANTLLSMQSFLVEDLHEVEPPAAGWRCFATNGGGDEEVDSREQPKGRVGICKVDREQLSKQRQQGEFSHCHMPIGYLFINDGKGIATIDKIATVCYALANLNGPIVPFD